MSTVTTNHMKEYVKEVFENKDEERIEALNNFVYYICEVADEYKSMDFLEAVDLETEWDKLKEVEGPDRDVFEERVETFSDLLFRQMNKLEEIGLLHIQLRGFLKGLGKAYLEDEAENQRMKNDPGLASLFEKVNKVGANLERLRLGSGKKKPTNYMKKYVDDAVDGEPENEEKAKKKAGQIDLVFKKIKKYLDGAENEKLNDLENRWGMVKKHEEDTKKFSEDLYGLLLDFEKVLGEAAGFLSLKSAFKSDKFNKNNQQKMSNPPKLARSRAQSNRTSANLLQKRDSLERLVPATSQNPYPDKKAKSNNSVTDSQGDAKQRSIRVTKKPFRPKIPVPNIPFHGAREMKRPSALENLSDNRSANTANTNTAMTARSRREGVNGLFTVVNTAGGSTVDGSTVDGRVTSVDHTIPKSPDVSNVTGGPGTGQSYRGG